MACDTKERIIEEALRLFSEKGYAGTSMSDIAERLKITKAALYKHYSGKREIFQKILDRMSALDAERAAEYDMPGAEDDEYAEAYMNTALDSIRRYSIAQFRHWTEDGFSSRFRKMLTIEQYNDSTMADLYQNYLARVPRNTWQGYFAVRRQPMRRRCSLRLNSTGQCSCFTACMTEQRPMMKEKVRFLHWMSISLGLRKG